MREPDISDMKDIFDIKSIEPEAHIFSDYLVYVLIVVAIILIVFCLYRYFKHSGGRRLFIRRKKRNSADIDPVSQFLSELLVLRKRKYWLSNEKKLHFSILSDAIRRFLTLQYGFNATEMTTSEIDEALGKMKLSSRGNVINMLRRADLVKFAKYVPTDEECRQSVAESEKLISG